MPYTQMYLPEKLKQDEEYRTRALRDLEHEKALPDDLKRPVVVQLGGCDIKEMVEAAQLFAPHCDGIGMAYHSNKGINTNLTNCLPHH